MKHINEIYIYIVILCMIYIVICLHGRVALIWPPASLKKTIEECFPSHTPLNLPTNIQVKRIHKRQGNRQSEFFSLSAILFIHEDVIIIRWCCTLPRRIKLFWSVEQPWKERKWILHVPWWNQVLRILWCVHFLYHIWHGYSWYHVLCVNMDLI